MNRTSLFAVAWFLVCAGATPAAFQVPPGFAIERVAGAPELRFPMFATFDDRGRLFVAESSGGDLYADLAALKKNCRVSVLEDRDGDGRFDSADVFADQLVLPMGLVWREGKLYLTQGPELVALADADGDGRADQRATILRGFGHTDNGGLHGLIFGPDGLLYMTIGQPDGYRFKNAQGEDVWSGIGALLRCRADGSHPEVLCRGFENLVEIVFLPTGEIIGTDNWFQLPSGGIRDALVHLVEGGKYPHMADHGSPLPVTGDDLPALAKFPAVALSGMMRIEHGKFPAAWRGHLLSAQFNRRCIQRHVLTREGATFRSENVDFVTSDDPDFHPADVLAAPDGSVLIVDTGGWYVQHCPTGKIRASDAPGAIYRVRFTGGESVAGEPLAALWQEPADELRRRLGERDADAVALAARILGSRKERGCSDALAGLLRAPAAHVQLAAAEALAHCGEAPAVPKIWEALAAATDPFLQHSLIHAAWRIASEEQLRAALEAPSAGMQAAALLLLDQPPRRALAFAAVEPRLASRDDLVRGTALRVLQRHPEWAADAAGFIRRLLTQPALGDAEAEGLRALVVAFRTRSAMQRLVAELLVDQSLAALRRGLLLEALARIGVGDLPKPWAAALGGALAESALRAPAVRALAALQLPQFDGALAKLADDSRESVAVRLDALRGVIARRPQLSEPAFLLLAEELGAGRDPLVRLAAAQLLARATLDAAQKEEVKKLAGTDPLITPTLFPSTAATSEEQRALLAKYEHALLGGDADRGRVLYAGKVLCASCHRAGGEGGTIGPDLTKIGAIRSRRDLLESIALPSATFAQGYEPYVVTTTDGATLLGTLARQTADTLLLRAPNGAEQRVGRARVRSMERSPTSLMPPGLDRLLTLEEMRDLLAYLESLR